MGMMRWEKESSLADNESEVQTVNCQEITCEGDTAVQICSMDSSSRTSAMRAKTESLAQVRLESPAAHLNRHFCPAPSPARMTASLADCLKLFLDTCRADNSIAMQSGSGQSGSMHASMHLRCIS